MDSNKSSILRKAPPTWGRGWGRGKTLVYVMLLFVLFFSGSLPASSQFAMQNISGRKCTSLNGTWTAIPDPIDAGNWRQIWKERKPEKKSDFFEYSFEGAPVLNVPGDFNTQMPELKFYEGTVWYKTTFKHTPAAGKRKFLHFSAVNYMADVYLNGELLGKHEGGFTPFQFEITKPVKEGSNTIIVRVNNQRPVDGIPGTGFDWLNYGGITREVNLVETNSSFIEDYFIQLKKNSQTEVLGWIALNGDNLSQNINIRIPELGVNYKTKSTSDGRAELKFSSEFSLWSPENPKLYKVIIQSETDTVIDEIGFRNIEVRGPEIFLNGEKIFIKGVNIHEENPLKPAKAWSEEDARLLLSWAKELGCNLVRLAHYPHSEIMVKMAEKMGLMVWDEIPVYQHISFSSPGVPAKIEYMMHEMIRRDRNRCGVVIWSLSNETFHFTPGRDSTLIDLTVKCRQIDSTRLITNVFCNQRYEKNIVNVWDPVNSYLDIVCVNEYLGWYQPWYGDPKVAAWKLGFMDKPLIISEFGGEAKFGSNFGPKDEANSWREEFQEQIYKDQVQMFKTTPNLCGVIPWLLVDYRSPGRMHPVYQNGWNRKGLYSESGEKKKAWYVMNNYFESIGN